MGPRLFVLLAVVSLQALAVASSGSQSCPLRPTSCTGTGSATQSIHLKVVTDSAVYDKAVSPHQACGNPSPVTVEVQFHIVFLDRIDQALGQVSLGGYLRQWWQDSRLAFNDTANGGCFDSMVMSEDPEHTIWTPNLYIDNLVDVNHKGAQLVHINPDGSIWWSKFLHISTKASMHFSKLPFDSHRVSVDLASYSLDNTIVRLVARGGTPGVARSGIGISSAPISSSMWDIQDGESSDPGGMQTAGRLEVKFSGTWDYISCGFKISRKPKYFVEQVLMQDFLFLGVSYAGFYVDPKVAPARAAMAVIPVLIMRTLANSVFQGLPQLSYSMWLADYLQVSMWLCVLCVVQFAITQVCLVGENRCHAYNLKLQATEKEMRKIIREARRRGMCTEKLLESYQLEPEGEDRQKNWLYVAPTPSQEAAVEDGAEGAKGRPMIETRHSVSRTEDTITEASLGVLHNAAATFQKFDKDRSGSLAPDEIRRMLVTFNVFMTTKDCADAMCKFIRDRGQASMKDSMKASLRLGEFIEFLYDIDDYLIAVPRRVSHPFSQALPFSRRWDLAAMLFFPLVVVIKMIIFFSIVGVYDNNATGVEGK